MRKVVHLTSVHSPFDTRIFYKECRSLARAGYEVTLVAPHNRDEVRRGVRILGVAQPSGRADRMLSTARRVVERALMQKPDLLHIHDPELLPWIRVRYQAQCPVVYDMHENLPAQVESKRWIPSLLRPLVAGIVRLGLRVLLWRTPVVFAERSYSDEFHHIHNAVVVQNMPLATEMSQIDEPKYDQPTVGYIGGVWPERGSYTVLCALARLRDKGVHARWKCVGPVQKGHLRELRRAADDLGVLPQVDFTGYLPPWEGWRMMSRCHVGLAILQPTKNYVRSYPTKLFEYMALGLPVIVSNTPLYQEVVESADCGLAIDPEDDAALAQALADILRDPAWARVIGNRGREAVRQRFNWKLEETRLLAFYEDVISSQDGGEGTQLNGPHQRAC